MAWQKVGTSTVRGKTQPTPDNPRGNVTYNQWRNDQTNENITLPQGQDPNKGQFQGARARKFSSDANIEKKRAEEGFTIRREKGGDTRVPPTRAKPRKQEPTQQSTFAASLARRQESLQRREEQEPNFSTIGGERIRINASGTSATTIDFSPLMQDDTTPTRRDNRGGSAFSSSALDNPQTTFEKRVARTESLERAQGRFLSTIKFNEATRKIDQFTSKIVPGSGPVSQRVEGALSVVPKTPFYGAALVSSVPVATAKTLAVAEGTIRPSSRSLVLPELKRTGSETRSELGRTIRDPRVQGEVAVAPLVPGIVKKASSKLPKVRAESVRIPTEKPFNIRSLSVERGGLSVGLSTGKSFKLTELKEPVAAPRTAGATKAVARRANLSPAESVRVSEIQKQIRLLGSEKGNVVNQPFQNVESLQSPKTSGRVIEQELAKEGGVVFGTATTQQLPTGFVQKAGDIDVIFPRKSEAQLVGVVQSLTGRLQRAGEPVRVSPENPLIIEQVPRGKGFGEKVFEAKSGVDPGKFSGPEAANVGGLGFDFANLKGGQVGSTVRFGEARAITAGEQLTRKGVASAFFRPEDLGPRTPPEFQGAGVLPLGKRTKDIAGFVGSSRGISEIAQGSINPIRRSRGRRARESSERFLETFNPKQREFIEKQFAEKTGNFEFRFVKELESPRGLSPLGSGRESPSLSPLSSRSTSSGLLSSPSPFSPSPRSSFPSPKPSLSPLSSFGSPSRSPSPSRSISRSPSPSPSPSPKSSLLSPSPSPSKSPSVYSSLSSLSKSPSVSPSPSPSPSGIFNTPTIGGGLRNDDLGTIIGTTTRKKGRSNRGFRGTPSLSVISLGKKAAGVKLSKKQLLGREEINPLQIRKV